MDGWCHLFNKFVNLIFSETLLFYVHVYMYENASWHIMEVVEMHVQVFRGFSLGSN